MIKSLAKLGQHQHIQILPAYEKETVIVTILFKPKEKSGQTIKPIQIEGTIAEVEAYLAKDFNVQVDGIVGLVTNIGEAEADLKKAKKEKEDAAADARKTKTEKKATPAKPSKSTPEKKGKAAKAPAKPTPAAPAKPEKKPALVPAYKKLKAPAAATAAPELDDGELADLFKEEGK